MRSQFLGLLGEMTISSPVARTGSFLACRGRLLTTVVTKSMSVQLRTGRWWPSAAGIEAPLAAEAPGTGSSRPKGEVGRQEIAAS